MNLLDRKYIIFLNIILGPLNLIAMDPSSRSVYPGHQTRQSTQDKSLQSGVHHELCRMAGQDQPFACKIPTVPARNIQANSQDQEFAAQQETKKLQAQENELRALQEVAQPSLNIKEVDVPQEDRALANALAICFQLDGEMNAGLGLPRGIKNLVFEYAKRLEIIRKFKAELLPFLQLQKDMGMGPDIASLLFNGQETKEVEQVREQLGFLRAFDKPYPLPRLIDKEIINIGIKGPDLMIKDFSSDQIIDEYVSDIAFKSIQTFLCKDGRFLILARLENKDILVFNYCTALINQAHQEAIAQAIEPELGRAILEDLTHADFSDKNLQVKLRQLIYEYAVSQDDKKVEKDTKIEAEQQQQAPINNSQQSRCLVQ